MLSRTADCLYWMARYTERAENTARMLDVNHQTSLLPQPSEFLEQSWKKLLTISKLEEAFLSKHDVVNRENVLDFMIYETSNPSSIVSCLYAARENARVIRGKITSEAWETQNTTWLELQRILEARHQLDNIVCYSGLKDTTFDDLQKGLSLRSTLQNRPPLA